MNQPSQRAVCSFYTWGSRRPATPPFYYLSTEPHGENLALSREVVFRAIFRHGGLVWKKLCITIYPMSTSNSFMKKKTTFDRGKPVKNHRLIGSTLCSKAAGVCLGYWRLWAFVSNEAYGQYLWITTCKKHSLEVILGGVVL